MRSAHGNSLHFISSAVHFLFNNFPGFGIARSAPVGRRVGTAAMPLGGGATLGFGERFFCKFSPKMGFLGDVCVEKIDFLGNFL